MDQNRSLKVLADGISVADGCHIRLRGKITLSLYPDLFQLDIWYLSDEGFYALGNASLLEVYHEKDLIASGEVSEVTRRELPEGELTTVSFGLGLSFWESRVSLTVPAGSRVSETVKMILAAAKDPSMAQRTQGVDHSGSSVNSTPISLGPWSGADPAFTRSQAFHGRTADAISTALSAIHASAYLTAGGLQVIPPGGTFEEKSFDLDNDSGLWLMEPRTINV